LEGVGKPSLWPQQDEKAWNMGMRLSKDSTGCGQWQQPKAFEDSASTSESRAIGGTAPPRSLQASAVNGLSAHATPDTRPITLSRDDREILDELNKLRNQIRGFSVPFYTDKQFCHDDLLPALITLQIFSTLVPCNTHTLDTTLKEVTLALGTTLADKSARRSFVEGIVWAALEIWVFKNAETVQVAVQSHMKIIEAVLRTPLYCMSLYLTPPYKH
jgi:hypothetical protein